MKITGHGWCRIWAAWAATRTCLNHCQLLHCSRKPWIHQKRRNIFFEFWILKIQKKVRTTRKAPGKHLQFCCSFPKKLGEQASKPQDLNPFYSREGWEFSVVSMTCSRPATDMTNSIGVPQDQVPSVIPTAHRLGTGTFPFASLELLLPFLVDARCVHIVTLTWSTGKLHHQNLPWSTSWQTRFRGGRRKRTSEIIPELVVSLSYGDF